MSQRIASLGSLVLAAVTLIACADATVPSHPSLRGSARPAFNAQALPAGDALVPVNTLFGFSRAALVTVDRLTGARTVLSDFSNPSQGITTRGLHSVAVDPFGRIWALTASYLNSRAGGALFTVDGATGQRFLLSDFGDPAQGPTANSTFRVISDGNLAFVSDARNVPPGAIYKVDALSGARAIVSDFGNPAQGPLGRTPFNMAFDAAGDIIVTDLRAGPSGRGLVFRVNRVTGQRAIIADFVGPAGAPELPHGLAIDAAGQLFVTTTQGSASVLLRIDPATGGKVVVSRFGDPSQGPTSLGAVRSIAFEANGQLLAADETSGPGAGLVFRIDPATGMRTVVSDFGDATQGPIGTPPAGAHPWDIVIVPGFVLEVGIDIRPGSADNPVNVKSRGKIPVAILSTADFDAAARIAIGSLTFGRAGDEPSLSHCGAPEDVNSDGLADVVCHFDTQTAAFQPGDTEGILSGETHDGLPIRGTDAVRVN